MTRTQPILKSIGSVAFAAESPAARTRGIRTTRSNWNAPGTIARRSDRTAALCRDNAFPHACWQELVLRRSIFGSEARSRIETQRDFGCAGAVEHRRGPSHNQFLSYAFCRRWTRP